MITATDAQAAATPRPAHGPIGTMSVPGTVPWTESPAIIGNATCSCSRNGSGTRSDAIIGRYSNAQDDRDRASDATLHDRGDTQAQQRQQHEVHDRSDHRSDRRGIRE